MPKSKSLILMRLEISTPKGATTNSKPEETKSCCENKPDRFTLKGKAITCDGFFVRL
ncbi:MAG: hypothetical protein JEZ01_19670 [Labilibaculum sp.]|nr:hypothetical protein [Labilibaculum sp.]